MLKIAPNKIEWFKKHYAEYGFVERKTKDRVIYVCELENNGDEEGFEVVGEILVNYSGDYENYNIYIWVGLDEERINDEEYVFAEFFTELPDLIYDLIAMRVIIREKGDE